MHDHDAHLRNQLENLNRLAQQRGQEGVALPTGVAAQYQDAQRQQALLINTALQIYSTLAAIEFRVQWERIFAQQQEWLDQHHGEGEGWKGEQEPPKFGIQHQPDMLAEISFKYAQEFWGYVGKRQQAVAEPEKAKEK